MDLMDLIDNWKKIAGMNSPMLPGQPPQATPPFVPSEAAGSRAKTQATLPMAVRDEDCAAQV